MLGRIGNVIVFTGIDREDIIEHLDELNIEPTEEMVENILKQLDNQVDQEGITDFISSQIEDALEELGIESGEEDE